MAKKPEQLDLVEEVARLTPRGHEVPDPTPMAPPVGFKKQPSMIENIRAMVRSENLRLAAQQAGMETMDEADDFEVGDDYDPSSPYEHDFDPPLPAEPTPKPQEPAAAGGSAAGVTNNPPASPATPPAPEAPPKAP